MSRLSQSVREWLVSLQPPALCVGTSDGSALLVIAAGRAVGLELAKSAKASRLRRHAEAQRVPWRRVESLKQAQKVLWGLLLDSGAGAGSQMNGFSLERLQAFLERLAVHRNVRRACHEAGMSHSTLYRHMRKDSGFRRLFDAVRREPVYGTGDAADG